MNVVEIRAIKVKAPQPLEEIEAFCLKVLNEIGKENWNVSVLFCDDAFIQNLNGNYRGLFKPTDVLSFSQDSDTEAGGFHFAGDVVVSIETMKINAAMQKTTEKCEMKRLLTHGLLHLAGMDHEEDAVEGEMLDLQERILRKYSGE